MNWRWRRHPDAFIPRAARWVEALLVLLLLSQVARLCWAIATPVGMFGDWQARTPVVLPAEARTSLFRAFDPFFRAAEGSTASAQVTSLALTLFGTRINESTGGGSAIIATPDGVQSSYAAGDEIMPGVTLKSVAFDHVVIVRGAAPETLFLDQSGGAAGGGAVAGGGGAAGGQPALAATSEPGPVTPAVIARDIGFTPRIDGGRMTGIVVAQKGAEGFARAGFRAGDIITQINGRPITSAGDVQALQAQIRPGARLSLMVERGAATVPLAITIAGGQ